MSENVISQRKPCYPVTPELRAYLERYGRSSPLPVSYDQLLDCREAYPSPSASAQGGGHWLTFVYDPEVLKELNRVLCMAYSAMKTDGDLSVMEHLSIERIDFCKFGNSQPFRIRIVNHFNDNSDHFYIKKADASRLFGLELEHILSPNRLIYTVSSETLIEEHIAGVPGDQFIAHHLDRETLNRVRLAKEFVKFNERCFVRLLGDMRSQNYVIDITPDFEGEQYRVRAIDFDQQSYEGDYRHYLPYKWGNNREVVGLCESLLNAATVRQYKHEEHTLIARRARLLQDRIHRLLECMRRSECSTPEKTRLLARGLGEHHRTLRFRNCRTMADIVARQIDSCLAHAKRQLRAP